MIGVQGGDSFGKAEQVRPRRSVSDEEAHGPPEESGVLHGNQQRYLENKKTKSVFYTKISENFI